MVREVRMEEDECMLVRKTGLRGQSRSKLGKRGVGVDEEGLQSMERVEGDGGELRGGL